MGISIKCGSSLIEYNSMTTSIFKQWDGLMECDRQTLVTEIR